VAPGPALQIVGESTRRAGDPVPAASPWFDGSRISLVAARGETIGFQVLHRGGGPVSLAIASPSLQVAGYRVEPLDVRRPSTAMYGGSRGTGAYADRPVLSTPPDTHPAYFEITVARDAPPGAITGTLAVAGRTLPVALTIAPVTLPDEPPRVWAYEDAREYGWGSGTEADCVAMFRKHGVLLSPDVHIEDWPARKAALAGIHDLPVWISDDPAQAVPQVRAWIAATRGTGQLPFAIPIDEPHTPAVREKVRQLADAVHAAGAGPDTFRYALTDAPHPEYGNAIDLYITVKAKLADTYPRWSYNGAPPGAGALVLDAEPPGTRTWGWIAWRYHIPSWYVWDALYWHDRHNRKGAPLPGRALDLADPISFDDGDDRGNLDGVLALPGCIPTLRLAALGRGFEDRALLDLAAACDRGSAERIAAQLVPRALGDATGEPAWPRDDAAWETARRALIRIASCVTSR